MKPLTDGKSAPKKHRGLCKPWKPGESGNPAGRPKGSRNKLGEEFITGLCHDWCQHGAAALKKVRACPSANKARSRRGGHRR